MWNDNFVKHGSEGLENLVIQQAVIRRTATECSAMLPSEWVRKNLEFFPDEVQTRVLDSNTKRGILNCTRQWGKSSVTAAMAVHQAATVKGSLTIVVSPSSRQSAEFVRKAAEYARRLGVPTKSDGDNEVSLAFPNHSRIVGLPGTEATVRGFSAVALLLVDEAARVSDELYQAVFPMLAVSNGKLWMMSTPFHKQGFFYETWENGGENWVRVRVRADECPRIGQDFLEEQREKNAWFAREYCCEFSDAEDALFDRATLEAALDPTVVPLVFK